MVYEAGIITPIQSGLAKNWQNNQAGGLPEGDFIVIGQILPLVKFILGEMMTSK